MQPSIASCSTRSVLRVPPITQTSSPSLAENDREECSDRNPPKQYAASMKKMFLALLEQSHGLLAVEVGVPEYKRLPVQVPYTAGVGDDLPKVMIGPHVVVNAVVHGH